MRLEIVIALSGIVFTAVAIFTAYRRRQKTNELRNLLEFAQNQIDQLQDALLRDREASDAALQRASDQARRVAWLETRVRKPRSNNEDVLDDSIITERPKLSMTERRHRVIALNRRGNNIESIAESLGLFKGEVELILSLDQAARSEAI